MNTRRGLSVLVVAAAATCAACAATNPASTTDHGTAARWIVQEGPDDSRTDGVSTYSVICTRMATPGGWREVVIPAARAYSFRQGDPCPTGPIVHAAVCGPSGPTDVRPDDGVTNAIAILRCDQVTGQ